MELKREILQMIKEKGDVKHVWGSICENILIRYSRELENEGYIKNGRITEEGETWLKS
jgi:predicted transcriptional regulator